MAKKGAAPNPAGNEKPAGKFKLIIVILIAVLVAMALSVAGTWFYLSKQSGGDSEPSASAEQAAPVGKQPAIYEELAPAFVVNFTHEGRARYMQVSVALMARDKAALDALKVHMPVLRNRLVMLFGNADFGTLMSAPGRELLRQQATVSVQELAQKETGKVTVEQVLFTNLVLQ
ncbi:flagellar basal body-associated protein FliL [Ectopseudomonas mendocina]|uniref:Flagellar protein FliL n=1 Tax=Ectopseudomonas mendocina TaxID=300 RepID=A0ABZ2RDI7_ECTME